ncbi:LysR family transcriptional regulator [Bosea sp. SSUT16]|jgi:DNA-binding transcriptional LysR family regulator|uniref:LysR family transcriptional regulator n=1 Tax=Bosea spartocytisi TaxID=2773451 RepID=A0A927EFE5_9HYPH|nr:LysR family transcriptional regulator [Bosea spartocytisi]MBD3847924.1 LysR family transcriptional regulator [Bosea spartocytisi]MCT4470232.1 LysR family transcriptional regulator [Bosea spartocytisi]
MNLRSVDLNLLVVLDALLDEAHVSRAADRIGLSQPAMSSALDRCRQLFGDRLLERGPGGMVLTPKAHALAGPVKDILASTKSLLDRNEPDLMAIRQTVRVVTADYPAVAIAPELHRRLARTAPGITVVLMPWHGAAAALEGLGRGTIDLAISVFPVVEADFTRRELLRESYLVVMRRGHPAAAGFDLEGWLAHPHVLVSGRGDTKGPLDEALARIGRERHVGMVVPNFTMVLPLVAGSDMIGLLPSRCLQDGDDAFVTFPPPLAVEGFPLHSAWHKRRAGDPAVQHVARLIEDLILALPVGG